MSLAIKNNKHKVFDFFSNRPPLLYIVISVIIHFLCLYVCNLYNNPNPHSLYFIKGDAIGYVIGCENLYRYGTYIIANNVACRMPGMAVLYIPLRLFFSQQITLTLFIIIQTLLSANATYLLANIAGKIFHSKKMFLCVFILYLASTFVANYNNFLLTESLCVSTLIISVFYLLQFGEEKKYPFLLLSGIFITWSIFLRPFIFPVLLIFVLYLIVYTSKSRIKYILLLLVPFMVIESLWICRNYYSTGKFIPFQTDGPFIGEKYTIFLKAFGLDYSYSAEGGWFLSDKQIDTWKVVRPSDSIFPAYIFTKGLTLDSLKYARYCYIQAQNEKLRQNERHYYLNKANTLFEKFINTHSYVTTHIYSRIVLLCKFLNQPVGVPLRSITYPFNVLAIFVDSCINYFVLLSGFISLFFCAINWKKNFKVIVLICSIPAYILILFPIYFQFIESREITLAYPFLSITSTYLFLELFKRYKWKTVSLYVALFSILSIYSCVVNIVW